MLCRNIRLALHSANRARLAAAGVSGYLCCAPIPAGARIGAASFTGREIPGPRQCAETGMAEEANSGDKGESKQTREEREDRDRRLQQILRERGEDAAKLVRTWLADRETRKK